MRTLTQGQQDAISATVVPPINLVVCFDGNNKESSGLAGQLIDAFAVGGATVMPQALPLLTGGVPAFGILSAGVPADIKAAIAAVFPVAESTSSLNGFPGLYAAGADGFLYVGYEP